MPVITVSRGSMSGGEALAKALGERLACPVLGREVLVEAAAQLGVSEEMLTQKVARSPRVWERLTSNRRIYLVAVQSVLAERIVDGDLVYHGHAGHLLLGGVPGILNVRLIAPLEMRVKTVTERMKLDRKAAEEYVHDVDEERVRWTQLIYGVDWRDPTLYDMVLNLGEMSLETATSTVAHVASAPEFTANESLLTLLCDFRTECRVKLALATNQVTRDIALDVKAKGGVVTLAGGLAPAGIIGEIERRDEMSVLAAVRGVEGVTEVRWDR